ncbi:polyprenyl synthetase family protein [Clavibacter michiganensis]|uniref:polyprenyl synthetase family protein n=3 Tax=Clavibacter michiganensis TaxID=28447 RepID=UPI0003217D47|nr:polyprenyl synthetase family protein [Clavibacter michiganensis]OUD93751.1 (2E,6E)-farnesyl diphosphate synthase [Clavibacter michiganensis subsp. michiganensis]
MDATNLAAVSTSRQAHVNGVLDAFFARSLVRAEVMGDEYVKLWRTLESNTAGGKRFRPRMVMAAYDGLGGQDVQAAAHVGAAFEMLHTALIVHDDVIDRDFTRRGGPNVSGAYRDIATTQGLPQPLAEHRGMSAAVIAGDLALVNAYRLIDASGVRDLTRSHLMEILDDAVFASAAGELIDVEFSLTADVPSVDEILRMERLKTAVYSFEAPLQAGAVLAGASPAIVSALGDFGRDIGIAYQVVDDVLGVFGDEQETGKTNLGDLREGKRTVLIAHAVRSSEWGEISALVGKDDLSRGEAALVRSVLESSGARAYAEGVARDLAVAAVARLDDPVVPEALRRELAPVAESVLGRIR